MTPAIDDNVWIQETNTDKTESKVILLSWYWIEVSEEEEQMIDFITVWEEET